jgi:acyl-CoA reductase-like NAD-dependent aldehyde dehydrogenase
LKPSEFTSAPVSIIGDIARGLLPQGLVQIVLVAGLTAANPVASAGIDGVTFTGS